MSRVILPFNHQPISTENGNESDPYTCPAGKYARVVCTMSVSQWGIAQTQATNSGQSAFATAASDSAVVDFWLRAGMILDGSVSVGTATTGSTPSGTCSATSTVSITIGGNTVARIAASASAGHDNGNNSSTTSSVTGTASFFYYAEEYNELT